MPETPPARAGYQGETYYQRPALKASPFDWKVSAYIFVGGLAGASQLVATVADLAGGGRHGRVVRNGRYLALLGALAGAPLLIADLHTPQRWYNMLRIFRRTSPMSIGTWVLSTFGLFSAVTAGGQALGNVANPDRRAFFRRLASMAQVPAAAAGAGMTTYPAALLSATSTPLWAASPRLLGARFASSSVASAAADLSLVEQFGGRDASRRTLDNLTLIATAADLGLGLASLKEYRAKGVAGPLEEGRLGLMHRAGVLGAGNALPIACYGFNLLGGRSKRLSLLAALGVLAGSYLMRHVVLYAGNQSALRPQDYFRFTLPPQPRPDGSGQVFRP